MANHHKTSEMKMSEPGHVRRAKGGSVPGSKKFVEKGAGQKDGMPEKLAKPGRKAGGSVKGKKPMARPDKRARGGATADANPTTTAGKVSKMPFENKQAPEKDTGGEGADKD